MYSLAQTRTSLPSSMAGVDVGVTGRCGGVAGRGGGVAGRVTPSAGPGGAVRELRAGGYTAAGTALAAARSTGTGTVGIQGAILQKPEQNYAQSKME